MTSVIRIGLAIVASLLLGLGIPASGQDAPVTSAPAAGFTDVTDATGMTANLARSWKLGQEDIKMGNRWWLSGFDFVDFDSDGNLDLFISGHGTQGIFCRNDGKGHFTWVDPKMDTPRRKKAHADLPFPGGELRLAYDMDEDGRPDFFASWGDDEGVFYYNDTKDGVFNFHRPPQWTFFFRSCAVFDADGDGYLDFLCNTGDNGFNNGIRILFGDKEHKYSRVKEIPGNFNWLGTPADLTGDGTIELIAGHGGGYGGGRLGTSIHKLDKDFKAVDVTAAHGELRDNGHIFKGVMDLNHDGFLDLVCQTEGPERLTAWINDGQGHFTLKPGVFKGMEATETPKYYHAGNAVMVDLDNDGWPDIIVNGRSFLWVLRGMPDGTFQLYNKQWGIPMLASCAVGEGRCFGDYDNDGRLDLVTCDLNAEPYAKLRVLHNDLPKQHFIRIRPVGAPGRRAAAGAKIRVYEPGGLDDPKKLIAYEEVSIWCHESGHAYYVPVQTERHFGLGDRAACDVSVVFPGGKKVEKKGAAANRIVTVNEETGTVEEKELK